MRQSFKQLRANSPATVVKCNACKGTGLRAVTKLAAPGRKIYPPKCAKCAGKGQLKLA